MKPGNQKFIEERKENRANLGAQVVNGFSNKMGGNADQRHASATKRKPT